MIVVAIIGVLAAIAVPNFASLIRKSNEGATRGNLAVIRGAISVYYGDTEGQYPSDPGSLTVGARYLAALPAAKTPNYHPDAPSFLLVSQLTGFQDTGAWAYDAASGDGTFGQLWVDCTHTDSKGTMWTGY